VGPKTFGFIALWPYKWNKKRPHNYVRPHSQGTQIGAQVALQRCLILRSGEKKDSINTNRRLISGFIVVRPIQYSEVKLRVSGKSQLSCSTAGRKECHFRPWAYFLSSLWRSSDQRKCCSKQEAVLRHSHVFQTISNYNLRTLCWAMACQCRYMVFD